MRGIGPGGYTSALSPASGRAPIVDNRAVAEPPFTVGIEEEYLLVDLETRDLAPDPPAEMLREFQARWSEQVAPEFMRSQIEVGTRVCRRVGEAREELARLRTDIAEIAGRYGLAPIAASTHPFARWLEQKPTDRARYAALAEELQATVRRLLICGMHVHVGIDDEEVRIDLMSQFSYFLPHLLALSTSSPFWEGHDTGLHSYRLTVFDALPRTGLPQTFTSWAEYERHVQVLVHAGVIEDATMIWWDQRPSARFPTLETRIMDVATRLSHVESLAALVVSTLRMLYRLRGDNQRWRVYAPMLLDENRWHAMRHGPEAGMIDLGRGELVPFGRLLDEWIAMVAPDAEALGCADALARTPEILRDGTSARRQREVYAEAVAQGAEPPEALRAVVDHLIATTVDV